MLSCIAWAAGAFVFLPAITHAQGPNVPYSGPITITRGGVYTGNYRSLNSDVPCVRIETTDPVVLEGCVLTGAGDLVRVATEGADVTVRQCRGFGLQPTVNGQGRGRFIDIPYARRLTVEHNYMEHTSGIVVYRWRGNGSPNQTLTVRYNDVRNIDGRWRNGQGSTRSSFLLLNTVQQLSNVDISFNQVVNKANESLVEDNINFYNSSGTAQSTLQVHDNYVQGAYPFPATGSSFTGTGLTTDGDGLVLATAAGFIEAHHNQFVSTCNAAMNIAAGHDVYFHDNRMVTSGLLPDGTRLNATYAATAVFNFYQVLGSVFFNNRIERNTIGYVRWGSNNPFADRQDLSPGACSTCADNTHLPNPVTLSTEQNEWALWQQKLQANNVTVGVAGDSAPTNAAPTVSLTSPSDNNTSAVGTPLTLAATAADSDGSISKVEFFEGSTKIGEATTAPYQLNWTPPAAGSYQLTARASDNHNSAATSAPVTLTVTLPVPGNQGNLLANPSFDADGQGVQSPQNWYTWGGARDQNYVDYTESYGNAHAGTYHGTHYHPQPYEVYTYQIATNLANGLYTLRAWVKGGGGQSVAVMLAKNFGGSAMEVNIPATAGGTHGAWTQITLTDINVTNGQCEVGFYSRTDGAHQWIYFDDVELVSQVSSANRNAAAANAASISAPSVAKAATALTVYPNPAQGQFNVTTSFAQAGSVDIWLVTQQGLRAAHYQQQVQAGTNKLVVPAAALPAGPYLLHMQKGKEVRTQRVQLIH